MPRSRELKYAFFTDDELGEVSIGARLCFIGLLTLADYDGNVEDRPSRIRVRLFAYDHDVTDETVVAWIDELRDSRGRWVTRFEREGERWISVSSKLSPDRDAESRKRYTALWRANRKLALARDGVCVECGRYDELSVHHRRPVRVFGGSESAHDMGNLVTLCREHHERADATYRQTGEIYTKTIEDREK